MKPNPKIVYRYRSFSSSTVEMLCNDVLFFSNPVNFNDPFDCSPFIEVDCDVSRLHAILAELIESRVRTRTIAALRSAKVSDSRAASHAERVARREASDAADYLRYHAQNPEYEDPVHAEESLLRHKIEVELQNRYGKGICCFSEEHDNPLLWSHYGDQHRGVCIGYSVDRNPKPDLKQVNCEVA